MRKDLILFFFIHQKEDVQVNLLKSSTDSFMPRWQSSAIFIYAFIKIKCLLNSLFIVSTYIDMHMYFCWKLKANIMFVFHLQRDPFPLHFNQWKLNPQLNYPQIGTVLWSNWNLHESVVRMYHIQSQDKHESSGKQHSSLVPPAAWSQRGHQRQPSVQATRDFCCFCFCVEQHPLEDQ